VGYFKLKLHKYILGTPKTNITSCKKGSYMHFFKLIVLKCVLAVPVHSHTN